MPAAYEVGMPLQRMSRNAAYCSGSFSRLADDHGVKAAVLVVAADPHLLLPPLRRSAPGQGDHGIQRFMNWSNIGTVKASSPQRGE